jgi:SAM-dependent methyltransferase
MRAPATINPLAWLASLVSHRTSHATAISRPSRRVMPVSRVFGFDRGEPIDRYYIERFLDARRADIRGRVLEIGGRDYTQRYGGDAVTQSDVLHATDDKPDATLIGDLATGRGIPGDTFDCIILTQTLPFIYDVRSAIQHAYAALKPDGVVLATVPGISQISRYDMDRWGDFWRFTSLSIRRLFEEAFDPDEVSVQTHGNVLVATSFLQGRASRELRQADLSHHDPDYELLITVRATRGGQVAAADQGDVVDGACHSGRGAS